MLPAADACRKGATHASAGSLRVLGAGLAPVMDRNDPYAPPEHGLHHSDPESETGWKPLGFWARVLASIIDNILITVVMVPLAIPAMALMNGVEHGEVIWQLIASLIGAVVVIALWTTVGSTPGKMVLNAKVLDAKTMRPPGVWRSTGRYLGYLVSALPLGLGFLWVAWDRRKRAWHDHIAGTVVMRAVRPPIPTSG